MRISDWSSDVFFRSCLRFADASPIGRRFRSEGLPGQCGLPWPSVIVERQETKMPKLKTKSGVKKRFKLTATGKVKHGVVGKRHRLSSHNPKYIRQNRGTDVISDADARVIQRWAPYGL